MIPRPRGGRYSEPMTLTTPYAALFVLTTGLCLSACGGDDDAGGKKGSGGASGNAGSGGGNAGSGGGSAGSGGGSAGSGGGSAGSGGGSAGSGGGSAGSGGGSAGSGGGGTGGTPGACDYKVGSNGVLVMEAEDLTLSGSWKTANSASGAYGTGYIQWEGASQNNNPGQGVITVKLGIDQAGRYRMQWRSRIGKGTNTTEHNDTWVRYPDAESYYGLKGTAPNESRRYPKPKCDDTTFMAAINALPAVSSATCPNGSTKDGWMKVYCSGASNWNWSTNTSDNDGHAIYMEFKTAGTYSLELSARADYHLIDRIVIHREGVANNVAQDSNLKPTPCN